MLLNLGSQELVYILDLIKGDMSHSLTSILNVSTDCMHTWWVCIHPPTSSCVCFYITLAMTNACVSVSGVFKRPGTPASRGQVELCSSLLSTPLSLLALVCALDCKSVSLVHLHFSSAGENVWPQRHREREMEEKRCRWKISMLKKKKMLSPMWQMHRNKFNMSLSSSLMNTRQPAMT